MRDLWHRGSTWILGPVLIGLAAVGLAIGAEYVTNLNLKVVALCPLAPLFFMPAGFALLAYIGTRFVPGAQGSGIPQTIASINALGRDKSNHLLSVRLAIGKAALTLGGLAVGASIGREGPTVQIGASIMQAFHGRGPFKSESSRRILLLAGGAAGTGYATTRATLEHGTPLGWYFGIAKLLATLFSSASGIAGGIFAPSLAVGAGFGENIARLIPSLAPHSAIVLLTMAAYLSGVTRAPVTSFIIMMEMTDSHQMLLPLMTASVVATACSKVVCKTQLYLSLADNFPALSSRSALPPSVQLQVEQQGR